MSDQIEKSENSPRPSTPQTSGATAWTEVASSWRGPLPPPAALKAYNDVFPGCAERIVAMAESEGSHRRDLERFEAETDRLLFTGELASEKRGMWLAFVLAVLAIGVSASLIYMGLLAWGVGLVSLELISLVGLFIYGRNAKTKTQADAPISTQGKLPFPE